MAVTRALLLALFSLACAKGSPDAKPAKVLPKVAAKDEARVRAALQYRGAMQNYMRGDKERARQMLETAVDLDPTYAEPYKVLASIYKQSGDERACQMMQSYTRLAKTDASLVPRLHAAMCGD